MLLHMCEYDQMANLSNIFNYLCSSPSRALAARATSAVAPAVDIQNNLATLVDTLAQATSMIQAAGLAVPALTPARAALTATGTKQIKGIFQVG